MSLDTIEFSDGMESAFVCNFIQIFLMKFNILHRFSASVYFFAYNVFAP